VACSVGRVFGPVWSFSHVSQNLDLEGIADARPVAPARSLVEKFSSAWRNGGAIGVLGRGWQRTLRFIHEDCVERVLGRHEVIPTGGTQSLTSLRITGPNADLGAYYDPTPRLVIRALLSIPAPAQDWALVDIGSGRGRVLQEACRKPFRKVMGSNLRQSSTKPHARTSALCPRIVSNAAASLS
jgi:hypothetical protein